MILIHSTLKDVVSILDASLTVLNMKVRAA
jgi:hypothetical protein